ncbi:MAG: hypothetical protein AAF657_05200 [Acidobacteriota bacterium]
MKDKRTVPLLMGAATSASGLLIIASMVPEYLGVFDTLGLAQGSDSRLIVGGCLMVFGLLLILANFRR